MDLSSTGFDPTATRFLSSLMCAPGITPKVVLASAVQLRSRDLPDPVDSVIFEAIQECAAAGETGPSLVLARLREDGHLSRDVDRRIAQRLTNLTTSDPADPLQLPALASEIMDRAEVRVMEARARDITERAATMPRHERRDLMRVFWREFQGVTERLDAAVGRAGGPVESKPHLKAAA